MKVQFLYRLILIIACFTSGRSLYAQLNADFTSNKIKGCVPLVVQFSDLTAGGTPDSWEWNFGDGNTSTLKSPSRIYAIPGVYTVTLKVIKGASSDTETKTAYITVFSNPVSNFSGGPVREGCAPLNVLFADSSKAGAAPSAPVNAWQWSFGQGTVSYSQNPSHDYTAAGSYTVTLQVTDANGCKHTAFFNDYIQTTKPSAAYSADITYSCTYPLTVNFTNTSSGYGLNYVWTFGDGDTAYTLSPQHVYDTLGTYNTQLIVTDSFGCQDVKAINSNILIQNIESNFDFDKNQLCLGDTVFFSDLSNGNPSSWNWNFGDGTGATSKNPYHVFSSPGNYSISLISQNSSGCADTIVKNNLITVHPNPVAGFTSDSIACSRDVQFVNQSTGASSYQWSFFENTGFHTYTSTSAAGTLDMNFGYLQFNKHPSYFLPDTFSVSLVVQNAFGCKDSISKNKSLIIDLPDARFSPPHYWGGCRPLTVNFDANSSWSYESFVGYQWDFDNGVTSFTGPLESQVFTELRSYNVKLVVTTESGCTDSITNTIWSGDAAIPFFTFPPDTICNAQFVTLTDQSSGLTGQYIRWFWDLEIASQETFGPGAVVQMQDTGTYDISMTVFNNECPATFSISDGITIKGPVANFSFIQECADQGGDPYTVKFNDNSKVGESWLWDLGDGNTSTDTNVVHTYQNRGYYWVSLTVTNDSTGCSHTRYIGEITGGYPLYITDPVASFLTDTINGCVPFSPVITNTSIDVANNLWIWDINGITDTIYNPTRVLDTIGLYDVGLVVKDRRGCTDSLFLNDYFKAMGVKSNFVADTLTGCTPFTVKFTDLSSADSTIVGWLWDFGDGGLDSVNDPTYIFGTPGDYNIKLAIRDTNQCTDTLILSNYIKPTFPYPAFTASKTAACIGQDITFTNNTVPAAAPGMKYKWLFGDGDSSEVLNPVHSYLLEGNYTIQLHVTDTNGCDSVIVKNDYISIQSPTAKFSVSQTQASCPPFLVTFTDESFGTGINTASYNWSFGDGTQASTLKDPSHSYNFAGDFTLTMTVTTSAGCADDTIVPGLVSLEGPNGTFDASTKLGCRPLPVLFTANASNTINYLWDFGDGNVQAFPDSFVNYTYYSGGIYTPTLIIDDGLGCNFSIPSPFGSIVVNYTQFIFNADKDHICIGDSVHLTASSLISGTNFTYSPGLNISCTDCDSALVIPTDTTTYFIDVSSGGCPDRDSVTINVLQYPVASVSDDDTICSGRAAGLVAGGGLFYQWYPSQDLSCDDCPAPYASPLNTITFYVDVSNGYCLNSDSVKLFVNPSAQALFTADPPFGSIPLTVTFTNQSQLSDSYYWLLGNGKESSVQNPATLYQDTGTYIVKLIANNSFGCPDTFELVLPIDAISSLKSPDIFTPNGDGVNDYFTVYLTSKAISTFKGTIYNRWGQVIAVWKDVELGWNGRTESDVPAPDGTYFFVIHAEGIDGVQYQQQGTVTLVR